MYIILLKMSCSPFSAVSPCTFIWLIVDFLQKRGWIVWSAWLTTLYSSMINKNFLFSLFRGWGGGGEGRGKGWVEIKFLFSLYQGWNSTSQILFHYFEKVLVFVKRASSNLKIGASCSKRVDDGLCSDANISNLWFLLK